MKKSLLLVTFLIPMFLSAQYATKMFKGKQSKNEAYIDSLKNMNYDRIFPLWGAKAYKRGIDIQYPIGFMSNFFWMSQGITISNFNLGIDKPNGEELLPLTPLSTDILDFGENTNTSWSLNIRPDIWIFPFIDIYGIFGYGRSQTTVKSLLFNEELPTKPIEQSIATYGLGTLIAGGLGPVWFSIDANITWNKPELLDDATIANVVGIRMGKMFKFKNKPKSNISVWVGTMFITMQNETLGRIQLNEAIDDFEGIKDGLVQKIQDKIDDPGTKPILKPVLRKLKNAVENSEGKSVIIYNMDKQVKAHWNGLIGAQYQFNKNWQLRAEGGVIGDRKSFLISLNYRIQGFKKPGH